ncbi:hypothetical protein GCM10028825_45240 [Spirosoma agri]
MVIYIVNIVHITGFKAKNNPVVGRHSNGPEFCQIAREFMDARPHLLNISDRGQGIQLVKEPVNLAQVLSG